ncbi:hypothetical protein Riv7116_4512 [Rivularia sp. PCC 7116]|uniref:hypothetical protein n=1 Tax=Rivularia sp. PCC 7116 TaxID=373994 RepID=UPI00029EDBEB|nr:hypothetical protein [Rivularia sp. PCC 7116]AFY56933.1 hypothetical protein Riv7116_4512 [Rivularia sp. PCC 7116]
MSPAILSTVYKELAPLPGSVKLSLEYTHELPVETEDEQSNNSSTKRFANPPYWVSWNEKIGAWVNADGSEIKLMISEEARDMDIGELTLGFTSVLTGICLNLQGQVAIHANAISLEELGIAFVGYSGRGKSTLSAYCASRGAGFITDDVLVINDNNFVIPGNSRIKLYPHTGESLGLNNSQETNYKIFYQPENIGAVIHDAPVTMGIIYLLEESQNQDIYTETISQSQAVFSLVTHGYDVSLFIPKTPNLLNAYTKLVARVPVKKLFYPREFSMLPDVYNFLLEEIHNL